MFGTKMIRKSRRIRILKAESDRIKTKGFNGRAKTKNTNFIDNFLCLSAFFLQKSRLASIVINTIKNALKKGEKGYKAQLSGIKTHDSTDIYIPEKVA